MSHSEHNVMYMAVVEAAAHTESSSNSSEALVLRRTKEKDSGDETDSTTASPSPNRQDSWSRQDSSDSLLTLVDAESMGDAQLSPAMQDALDAQGASDELVEDWTNREIQALAPVSFGLGAPVLPQHVRHAALRFISYIAQLAGLPQKSLFEACLLLDVFLLKSRPQTHNQDSTVAAINTLPATCAALVAILKKNDCVSSSFSAGASSLIPLTRAFAQHLLALGYSEVNAEVTEDTLNTQEVRVLQALRWRIHLPTTESWMSTFCSRFNVLTRSLMVPSLTWVWQQGLATAGVIMMHQASSETQAPKKLAAGLLAVGLVSAHLLPLEAVRPQKMTAESWSQLYQATQQQELHQLGAGPASQSQRLLKLLTISVGVDLREIQEYAGLALFAMQAAFEAQARDRPLTGATGPVAAGLPPVAACAAHHSTI